MYRMLVVLALAASSAPAAVAAQTITGTSGPADPAAAVPALKYESAFTGYQSFREEKLRDWRALNEEVGRAGGHIGIFRGAGGQSGQPPVPAGGGHTH